MGIFSRRREEPAVHRGPAELPPEDQRSDVPLTDPGLPEGDLTQVTHRLLMDCGLMYVAYGPGSAAALYTDFLRVAPALGHCAPEPVGVSLLRDSNQIAWVALESERGSALAVLVFPGADVAFAMKHIHEPLKGLSAPWRWTLGTRSNRWNGEVAGIINSSRAVPVWDLPGLAHTRPAVHATALMPESFKGRLVGQGWTQGDGDFFTVSVTTRSGRDRNVHLMPYNAGHFATMSVVCDATADSALPIPLRGCELGEFELMVTADLVCLIGTVPAGPPSPGPDQVVHAAQAVADYAERLAEDMEYASNPMPGDPPNLLR